MLENNQIPYFNWEMHLFRQAQQFRRERKSFEEALSESQVALKNSKAGKKKALRIVIYAYGLEFARRLDFRFIKNRKTRKEKLDVLNQELRLLKSLGVSAEESAKFLESFAAIVAGKKNKYERAIGKSTLEIHQNGTIDINWKYRGNIVSGIELLSVITKALLPPLDGPKDKEDDAFNNASFYQHFNKMEFKRFEAINKSWLTEISKDGGPEQEWDYLWRDQKRDYDHLGNS